MTHEKGTAGEARRPVFTGERVIIGRGDPWWRGDTRDAEHFARYAFALARVAAKSNVVDVACGTGYGAGMMAEAGHRVVGFDINPEAVAFAAEQWPEASFGVADATALPVPDGSVDVMLSFETVEHLQDPSAFIQEVVRVLRHDGMFILSTPDRPVFALRSGHNEFHLSEMDRSELASLLERHFRVDWYGQTLHTSPSWLARHADRITTRVRRSSAQAALAPFTPQPLDARPWVFLVAVCRLLPLPDLPTSADLTDGLT